jgi:hypothetical protein
MRDAGQIGNVAMVNVADAFGIELADRAARRFEEAGSRSSTTRPTRWARRTCRR